MVTGHWLRRTLLVIFCLGLFGAVGVVFTQVIAARVPEQRATLEKLITDRTGLEVRFDNVHFAWNLDGTSAVFERVELTDPVRGRVRVVAPELRVEFDTWDFLRHQQFSLGHVTLKSPDIDIIGDAEPDGPNPQSPKSRQTAKSPSAVVAAGQADEEAALVRRFTAWAELMPIGRVEVEGARVHLFRRGESRARHDFTLSQAVVSRSHSAFNAFGTMLLSQDIGQSLFVSAKLEGVSAQRGVSGELRLIARRVLLDKLPGLAGDGAALATRGRGTVDARLTLTDSKVEHGQWQLSARELEWRNGSRFDHFTVTGTLARADHDLLLDFRDLQVTRGPRLERAPRIQARLGLAPRSVAVAYATADAERVPFMAAEFIAGALAPVDAPRASLPGWTPTAGELRGLKFDSRARQFTAQILGADILRAADGARLSGFQGQLTLARDDTTLTFDDATPLQVRLADTREPRELRLSGALRWRAGAELPELRLAALRLRSGEASLTGDGPWGDVSSSSQPLVLDMANVDRALLADVWTLLALPGSLPLDDVQQGRIVSGKLSLEPMLDADGNRMVNWSRSRGVLELAGLASAPADGPRLDAAAGKLEFSRVGARLRLTAGRVDELEITGARVDWPRKGEPRLQVSLRGDLKSPLLRQALADRGLERLAGAVALEADARGAAALRDPARWRVSARLSDASIPLAQGMPPVERLEGTLRLAEGQLRGLALTGSWLGGPVEIESRRAGARGVTSAGINGVAEIAPLLRLLGQRGATDQVSGQLAWSGTVQREGDDWRATLQSTLAGVESRLPGPFDKPRGRAQPVAAELTFGAGGIREFEVASERNVIRGRVDAGTTLVNFDVQGVAGELRTADAGESRLEIERLDVKTTPLVLATAGSWLPPDTEMRVRISEWRHARRALGALDASLAHREEGLEFTLDSVTGSPHEFNASGSCAPGPGDCRLEFTLTTGQLPVLLGDADLPAEWPTQSLRAAGELQWRADAGGDPARALRGAFELETQGADSAHQLVASATMADGQIDLANIQGSGPGPDQLFRGQGRVGLLARTYDLAIDYERVSLAASAVPTPARARFARAWTALRGSVANGSWAATEPARRVQWHGTWDGGDIPHVSD